VRGALNLIRWFIILGGLISFTTFVYALILKPRLKTLNLKGSLPGGIAFVVLWIGVSSLFSLYVDKMGTFNPVYGTLGALVLFVTWLYFSTLMLLIGGEIAVMNQDAELKITTRRPPNA
jgi:membrane protein